MFGRISGVSVTGTSQFQLVGSDTNSNTGTSEYATSGWQSWVRPKNASFVMLVCIGGGGAGGRGNTNVASTNRGGGGGGGSGAISTLLIPAALLPHVLYLSAGAQGIYLSGSAQGGWGGVSAIADSPNPQSDLNLILKADGGTGGTSSTGATGGVGGAGGIVYGGGLYTALGSFSSKVGQTGGQGGSSATPGTSITFGATGLPITSGAGGGSVSSSNVSTTGGSINGAGRAPTLVGGAVSSDGVAGVLYEMPFASLGGSGAGGNSAGGNVGGNAALGSGGGGGSGGTLGGFGGNGGPGAIVILCW